MPRLKPGEKPPRPGPYIEKGPLGGKVDKPKKVDIKPSTPKMPPTQKPGNTWEPA